MTLLSQINPPLLEQPKPRTNYFTRCDQDGLAKAWAKLRKAEGWTGVRRYQKEPVADTEAVADRMEIHATAKAWMTSAEIADAIGMDAKTCRARIQTMVKSRMLDTMGGRPKKYRALPEYRWSAATSATKRDRAISLLSEGPLTSTEIAERMGEHRSAMSLVMTRAFKHGLVTREYCKRPSNGGGGGGFYRYSVVTG